MRKDLWINPPLERVLKSASNFSRRLGDIVDRYELILKSTEAPIITEKERMILHDAFGSTIINETAIKNMGENILQSQVGTEEERKELAEKIIELNIVEKILIIEKIEGGKNGNSGN